METVLLKFVHILFFCFSDLSRELGSQHGSQEYFPADSKGEICPVQPSRLAFDGLHMHASGDLRMC